MSFFSQCKIRFIPESVQMKVISDADYFSSDFKSYISNSKLKLINPAEGGSPQLYQEGLKSTYSSYFEFGNAVHCLLLQPEDYYLSDYIDKPTAKLGLFWDKIIEYRKQGLGVNESIQRATISADYYKNKLSQKLLRKALDSGLKYYFDAMRTDLLKPVDGKEPIITAPKTQDEIIACLKSIKENDDIMNELTLQNLSESKIFRNEEALFIDIEVTLPNGRKITLPFKGKLDNYSIDPDSKEIVLNDLKTTGKYVSTFMGNFVDTLDTDGNITGQQFINGSFQKYHYFRQMGIYMLILQLYTKKLGYEGYTYKSNMLVVESQSPYNSKKYPVSLSYINEGLKEFKELMCRVAYHSIYGFDVELNENDYE